MYRTLPALVALLTACPVVQPQAQYCEEPGVPAPSSTPNLTYYQNVQPILNARCGACHDGNGPGPMGLTTWDDITVFHHDIYNAVLTRHMPPWPPVRCCAEYENAFAMTDDEAATVLGWHEQGFFKGTPADGGTVPTRATLARIDATTGMTEPYLPSPVGTVDETRCFLLEWSPAQAVTVTGLDIKPGAPLQMHDGRVMRVSADDAKRLQSVDDAAPGLGWPCPGGLFGNFEATMGGSFFQAQTYASGLGFAVQPSDRLVLAMHYSPPALGSFQQDLTHVDLMFETTPVTPLVYLPVFDPAWPSGGLTIPAGESDVVYRYAQGFTQGYDLRAVNLHMNERGTKGQVFIVHADGTRQCLLQVDTWDATHQGDYTLKTPVRLAKGDRVGVECHWDNTSAHQRLVNGKPETPGVLSWGEDEEMCVAYLTASEAAE